jgi:hypothetical protein
MPVYVGPTVEVEVLERIQPPTFGFVFQLDNLRLGQSMGPTAAKTSLEIHGNWFFVGSALRYDWISLLKPQGLLYIGFKGTTKNLELSMKVGYAVEQNPNVFIGFSASYLHKDQFNFKKRNKHFLTKPLI